MPGRRRQRGLLRGRLLATHNGRRYERPGFLHPPRVIVAYAGRRARSLPHDPNARLTERVRRLLSALQPSALVGAAADGSDLLVLESALKSASNATPHVVLPTSREDFSANSIEPDWLDRFHRVLERVDSSGGEVESLELTDGDGAYRAANERILEKASLLCQSGERVVGLVLGSAGEGAMINDFIERASLRGIPLLRLDPAVDLRSRPQCFVAMPFGKKYDVQRKIELDCDRVYDRIIVPVLENAQLRFRRADEQIDSGVVLQPMIQWLSDSDVVIGDLATNNFNVGWELGLRHLLRPQHTILMLPSGTSAPFDLSLLRHVSYEHREDGISDDAAIASWKALGAYLQQLDQHGRSDSPVDALMEITQWASLKLRGPQDTAWEQVREQLALARDLKDAELMLAIVQSTEGLGDVELELVQAEAGVGLVRLGAYREARSLLKGVVLSDESALRPNAHFFYAQSLYRPADATVADYDEAERVLKHLLLQRSDHPEVWAGLGAVNKRRSLHRTDAGFRRADVTGAMDAYIHDYARDLNAYYEGINVVACGVVLERVYGDVSAGAQARHFLPAVLVAASLAWKRDPTDYWAAVTLAEGRLYEAFLKLDTSVEEVVQAYAAAGALRPTRGFVDSSLTQLGWLKELDLPAAWLDAAARALVEAAGYPEPRVHVDAGDS